jgi:hypothetical protein
MSHFSVMVIGNDVQGQLQPFHEFECTGTDDRYVQALDITAEARATYEVETSRRYKDPDGRLYCPYDDQFYGDPTPEEERIMGRLAGTGGNGTISWHSKNWGDGEGYRARVSFVPDGWEEVEVPQREIQSFAAWAHDYYGSEILEEGEEPDLAGRHKYGWLRVSRVATPAGGYEVLAVIDRTNPNKHWDWWEIGGRWDGFLRLKDGLSANQSLKGDVDFGAMRDQARNEARERWRKAHSVIGGRDIQALRAADFYFDPEQFDCTEEEYAGRAADGAVRTFAVVKESQWYEKGRMGWWGIVRDEKDEGEWDRQFSALLDGLPDETLLTVVDCHI